MITQTTPKEPKMSLGNPRSPKGAIKSVPGDPPTTRQAASAIGFSLFNAPEVLARRFFDFLCTSHAEC